MQIPTLRARDELTRLQGCSRPACSFGFRCNDAIDAKDQRQRPLARRPHPRSLCFRPSPPDLHHGLSRFTPEVEQRFTVAPGRDGPSGKPARSLSFSFFVFVTPRMMIRALD